MNPVDRHRAVVEALGLSPDDLRRLAMALEDDVEVVLVREIAEAELARHPRHHRYAKSLERLIAWAGDRDAATVTSEEIAGWARRAGDEARADPRSRHGVGAEEGLTQAARAAYARAQAVGKVLVNPAAKVPLPHRPPSRRTALSPRQLRQAHHYLLARSRGPELDDLVFQFLRETACRRGGAIRLSGEGLGPATLALKLVEKYGKERWVPTSAHLMRRLVEHRQQRHPGAIGSCTARTVATSTTSGSRVSAAGSGRRRGPPSSG